MNNPSIVTLHVALQNRASEEEVLAILKEHPEASKVRDNNGQFPLHLAALHEASEKVVLALVEANPDAASQKDHTGWKPLHYALEFKAPEKVVLAILKAYPKIVKEVNYAGQLPLHYAFIHRASNEVVLAILNEFPEGAKAKSTNNVIPLHMAAMYQASEEVVLELLKVYPEGVKMKDNNKMLPIHYALGYNASKEVVLALLKVYPESIKVRDINGQMPLHYALENEASKEVVLALLKVYPESIKVRDNNGQMPLHYALENEASEEVVLALLKVYPGSIKEKSKNGMMPLPYALMRNECDNDFKAGTEIFLEMLEMDMPVVRENGINKSHSFSWTHCVASKADVAADAVRRVLEKDFHKHIRALAYAHDEQGRTALAMAAAGPREIIYDYLLFCGRYELELGAPKHVSMTSVVLSAIDHGEKDCDRRLGSDQRSIVIKLMQDEAQWDREKKARKENDLDSKYVVQQLRDVPSDETIRNQVARRAGGLDVIARMFNDNENVEIEKYQHAIIMLAGDRTLLDIHQSERPDFDRKRVILKDIFTAVDHLHGKNLMHGDIKMLNVVRFWDENLLRLIDFDACVRFNELGVADKVFAGLKFSSATLPPEMISELTETDRKKLQDYWEGEGMELPTKMAPKPIKKRGKEKWYAVKSYLISDDKPVRADDLPYELVPASSEIDVWALGVLSYELLTGERLLASNKDNDYTEGEPMQIIHLWRTQDKKARLKKIKDDAAYDLVSKMLEREPVDRPTLSKLLDEHPFFQRKGVNAEGNEAIFTKLEEMDGKLDVMKDLTIQNQRDIKNTCSVLLTGIFESSQVKVPTTFIILSEELPPVQHSDQLEEKVLQIVAEEDGTGVTLRSKFATVTLNANEQTLLLEGNLKKYEENFKTGMKWVKRIKKIGTVVASGKMATDAFETAFETIQEELEDLVIGNKMYLYLVDELTGDPVRADGWPIPITEPKKVVSKLLPAMQVGLRAMSIYNGTAGIARLFGCPVPKVPKAWSIGAQKSLEVLKQKSSVAEFGPLQDVLDADRSKKPNSLRGRSLREFEDFLQEYDPGLKKGKSGDFAGLRLIGNPKDGTALWTLLSDPDDISAAIKERSYQRDLEELRSQMTTGDDHIGGEDDDILAQGCCFWILPQITSHESGLNPVTSPVTSPTISISS